MQDPELIAQYLSGKQEYLDILLEKHLQNIFWACMRVCLDEQDAHDVTQNVLVKIIKYLHKFKQDSSFSTWYYRIAYNESISYLKKQKWHSDIDDFHEIIPSDENILLKIDAQLLSKEVTQHINKLPLLDRNIILYYYYDDLKLREIAEIMDLNENTVKTRLSRAKKLLSTKLSHYETTH